LEKDSKLQVEYAADGAEATRKIEQAAPDLIVTDLVMPEMDGLQLVKTIRSRFPFVPVILMTSQGTEEIAIEALREGAASYVPKRRLGQDLLETVHSLLVATAGRRGHARLMGRMSRIEFALALETDLTLVDPFVQYLQDNVADLGICDIADRTRIAVAVKEALLNAIYHGNLELGSKRREEDMREFLALATERSQEAPYRDRRVFVETKLSHQEAVFVVRDEGTGFDPSLLPDPTDPANLEKLSGRGVPLMRMLMDEVAYNSAGNEVTLVKRYSIDQPTDIA